MRVYYTSPVPYAKPSSPAPIVSYGTLAYGVYTPPEVTPAVVGGKLELRLGLGVLIAIIMGGSNG